MLFSGLSNCRSLEPAGEGGDVKLFLFHCIFPMITQKKKTYRDRTEGIFTIVVLAVDPVGM